MVFGVRLDVLEKMAPRDRQDRQDRQDRRDLQDPLDPQAQRGPQELLRCLLRLRNPNNVRMGGFVV